MTYQVVMPRRFPPGFGTTHDVVQRFVKAGAGFTRVIENQGEHLDSSLQESEWYGEQKRDSEGRIITYPELLEIL